MGLNIFKKINMSSIYTIIKFVYKLNISFIILWNSLGAFFKSKGITFHSYCPKGTVKVVLYLSYSNIWIWQNHNFKSKFEKILAFVNLCNKSCLFGKGYLIHCKVSLRDL